AFAEALDPQRVQRCRNLEVQHLDHRNVSGRGQRVVQQTGRQELTVGVVDELFEERATQTLGQSADDLAFGDRRIDQASGVADHNIPLEAHEPGLAVDVDHHGVD